MRRLLRPLLLALLVLRISAAPAYAELRGGVAKVDITDHEAGPVNDPCYAKALVLDRDGIRIVLVTVDAVAIGEIGRIGSDFLGTVRDALQRELDLNPDHLMINASHCHGVVCAEVADRTFQAVKAAAAALVPVAVGAGTGQRNGFQRGDGEAMGGLGVQPAQGRRAEVGQHSGVSRRGLEGDGVDHSSYRQGTVDVREQGPAA
jgi:hypothetical protein